jgi:hypothetical protein
MAPCLNRKRINKNVSIVARSKEKAPTDAGALEASKKKKVRQLHSREKIIEY